MIDASSNQCFGLALVFIGSSDNLASKLLNGCAINHSALNRSGDFCGFICRELSNRLVQRQRLNHASLLAANSQLHRLLRYQRSELL